MTSKDLSLSERLRVWESTGLEVVLRPTQISELRRNLDETVSFCMDNLIKAEQQRRTARRMLLLCWCVLAFSAIANLVPLVLQ